MERPLTLALVQMQPILGDLATNLEIVLERTEAAAQQGAQLVLFPELALTGYNQDLLGEQLVRLALGPQDEPLIKLGQAAARYHIHLVVGYIEKRAIPGVVYNSIAIFGPDGSLLRIYAKSHLFSGEHLHYRPGAEIRALSVEQGTFGPMICMDIGYPEVGRLLALQGAELFYAPSNWILEDQDLWPVHLQARALDNLAFMVGVNRVGTEGNLCFIGQSMVVNPRGHILARLDEHEGMLVTTIDLDEVTWARRRALHWTGRRPELYGPIADPEAN